MHPDMQLIMSHQIHLRRTPEVFLLSGKIRKLSAWTVFFEIDAVHERICCSLLEVAKQKRGAKFIHRRSESEVLSFDECESMKPRKSRELDACIASNHRLYLGMKLARLP
jgi:hypothetical protein